MRFDLIVLLIFLLCIAISDYKRAVIPDAYILSGIAFRILYLIFLKSYIDILKSLGSALLIFVPLLLMTVAYEKKTGKHGAGGGDLKNFSLAWFLPFSDGNFSDSIRRIIAPDNSFQIYNEASPTIWSSTVYCYGNCHGFYVIIATVATFFEKF